jgi:O-antigen/teichoic acid export membrane protein
MARTTEAASHDTQGQVAQLFGRDFIYLVLWAVQLLCAALFTPAITRVLGVSEFGTVTSANAAMQVLFIVAGFGLQAAVQREYAARPAFPGARRLVGFAVVAAVLVSVLAWMTVGLWSRPMGLADEPAALKLAVVWAGSSAITNISLGLLRSQDRLIAFATVSLMQSVIAEALSLVLAVTGHASAEDFLLGQVIAQLIAVGLGLILAPPALFLPSDRELVRNALRFALPLVPSVLSTFVLSTSDRLIVEAHLGSEAVARYQVAYNVAAMPMLLLSVLSSAWMPRFFGLTNENDRHTLLRVSRDALNRLMIPVVLGFAFGGPLVLRIWAPASYRPDQLQLVMTIVLVTVVPFAAQLSVTRTLMTVGQTTKIAWTTLLAAAVNVVLNLVLIPSYGLTGSAIATLAAYCLLYLVLSFFGRSVSLGSSPRATQLQLGLAIGIAFISAAVPESRLVILVRLVGALATLAWFLRVFLQISKKPTAEPTGRQPARAIL